jgi:hypothetical protein
MRLTKVPLLRDAARQTIQGVRKLLYCLAAGVVFTLVAAGCVLLLAPSIVSTTMWYLLQPAVRLAFKMFAQFMTGESGADNFITLIFLAALLNIPLSTALFFLLSKCWSLMRDPDVPKSRPSGMADSLREGSDS